MNLTTRLNGMKELRDYYELYSEPVTNTRFEPSPYNTGFDYVAHSNWKINHYGWLGMTEKKYLKIATRNIDPARFHNDGSHVYYSTLEDCEKAIVNLSEYLLRNEYGDGKI